MLLRKWKADQFIVILIFISILTSHQHISDDSTEIHWKPIYTLITIIVTSQLRWQINLNRSYNAENNEPYTLPFFPSFHQRLLVHMNLIW